MFSSVAAFHDHKDLIHDIAYDFHGTRIATCSSDQSVKVWDLNDNGQWNCSASWKVHSGSVWKVTWAHPEFGQVLATCSFDRTAAVWEEIVSDNSTGGNRGHQKHWIKRTSLVDSRSNVTGVAFAPKHLGLMLATCSQDGVVRIYEASDVMNLNQWNLQHEISVSKLRASCISWNSSKYHPPMIAVGSDDVSASGPKAGIYEYNESSRKWMKVESLSSFTEPVYDLQFAPNVGRSYHLLAMASKNLHLISLKPTSPPDGEASSKFELNHLAQFDDHNNQVWRVSWNITGTILSSAGADGSVRLWKANYMGNWKCISVLKPGEGGVIQTCSKPGSDRYY